MPSILKAAVTVASAIALQSCAAANGEAAGPMGKAAPFDTDRIEYSIGPCRGFCPAYTFAISTDGNARFSGGNYTAHPSERAVDGNPALFTQIKTAIAPARPTVAEQTIDGTTCKLFATDQQVVTVQWWSGGRAAQTLQFDLGCHDPELERVRAALAAARRLMPIDALVGRPTEF